MLYNIIIYGIITPYPSAELSQIPFSKMGNYLHLFS